MHTLRRRVTELTVKDIADVPRPLHTLILSEAGYTPEEIRKYQNYSITALVWLAYGVKWTEVVWEEESFNSCNDFLIELEANPAYAKELGYLYPVPEYVNFVQKEKLASYVNLTHLLDNLEFAEMDAAAGAVGKAEASWQATEEVLERYVEAYLDFIDETTENLFV